MSDEADLDRDLRLAEALGRLPAPALPTGLAERIVRSATALPQDAPAVVEPPLASWSPLSELRPVRSRRWRPYAAVGSAIAASIVAALLLQGPTQSDHPGQPQVAQNTRASAPAVQASALPSAASAGVPGERMAAATEPTRRAPAVRKARAAPEDDRAAPQSEMPQAAPADTNPAASPAPALANRDQATTPAPKPSEQALVGPPVPEDLDPAMQPGGPTPGFGITGGSAMPPSVSTSPAPQPRGRGPGGMPRF